MNQSRIVIDHEQIREFAAETGGTPALVQGTGEGGDGPGILRFDHGYENEGLTAIDWDRFFRIFEEQNLALMLDDSGDNPNFNKFVSRT